MYDGELIFSDRYFWHRRPITSRAFCFQQGTFSSAYISLLKQSLSYLNIQVQTIKVCEQTLKLVWESLTY